MKLQCNLCPRRCNAARYDNQNVGGFCGMPYLPKIARADLHFWEEPCISGKNGSGTIFFSGCTLRCVYCQNFEISHKNNGKIISTRELADIMRTLEEKGAHNINFVNPTHYFHIIKEALGIYKPKIPLVCNSSGYELTDNINEDIFDIYLFDLKYVSSDKSLKYSGVADYFDVASKAICAAYKLKGEPVIDKNGIMQSGVIVRHLVLPLSTNEAIAVIDWFCTNAPKAYLSIMSQYIPQAKAENYPEINRKITKREYEKVLNYLYTKDIKNLYIQDRLSADQKFIPDFNGGRNMLKTKEPIAVTTVEIVEVTTKAQLRKFVDFPNKLYKNHKNFVPAFYGDDIDDWDKKKNPAFSYCDGKCYLAYRDGEIVGRIGAILSHKANEKWGTRRMRFSQVDFIDDIEVSSALFAAVENWAKENDCNEVHGPLGFCDLDREGMLVEGFDKRNMFITYYNDPYYNEHLEKLGYKKDTDWVEYKIFAPAADSAEAERFHRIAEHIMKRKKLHKVKVLNRFGFAPYVTRVFELVNAAYSPLYGTVDLTAEQVKKYANKFIPLLNPKYTCFVMDENDELVAFGISAPSIADAMKKSNGRLFPTGWIGVLKAFNESKALDMFLIAVRPDLQGSGVNAVVLDHLIQNAAKNGIIYAETGPMLETNSKILAQWKSFDKELHKRRRCYLKKI